MQNLADSTWRAISAALLAAMLTGVSFNLYYSTTTISKEEARSLIEQARLESDGQEAAIQAELDLVRARQDDVRAALATIIADLAVLKAQHSQSEGARP